MIKTLISVLTVIALVCLPGCTSAPKLIKAMGTDKSSFKMRVTTIYGNVDILRANPGPGQSAEITPDGVLKVQWVGSTNVISNKSVPETVPPVKPQSRATPSNTLPVGYEFTPQTESLIHVRPVPLPPVPANSAP